MPLPKLLLCLLALAMHLSACQTIARHDPGLALAAQAERHAQLTMNVGAHGHVHDDGDSDEREIGHTHGHNPADHSHDTPVAVAVAAAGFPSIDHIWLAEAETAMSGRASDPMDRPPELLSSM